MTPAVMEHDEPSDIPRYEGEDSRYLHFVDANRDVNIPTSETYFEERTSRMVLVRLGRGGLRSMWHG